MNSFYHSTRGRADSVTSKQAILAGIAPDGGLYVTDTLGSAKLDLATVCAQDFHATARLVLGTLLPDFSADEIAACVEAAYGGTFDSAAVCPVTPIGGDWLLELYHGPTCAFKDVALQMLPQLISTARPEGGPNIMIVTATSGDTGKAALEGFADVPNTGVTVFYPAGGVSDVQYLQMVCQKGANVEIYGIHGNFDDAQTEVKRIFSDEALAKRLAERGVVLSSANSINVGRLAPQVTYYFDAYAQLVRAGVAKIGESVDFVVPTGNFGDVLAGYYAKCMGLPVGRLVVASNSNNVLTDFLTTGTYDRRRPFFKTISPSMDILVSSNLERLLYYASDGDCELVSSLMRDLSEKGAYTVPEKLLGVMRETFCCGFADEDATKAAIRTSWERDGVLIDPHTAVGVYCKDQLERTGNPVVCLSTASPYKFSAAVLSALGTDVEGLDGFACMDALEKATGTEAPAQLSQLRSAARLHEGVCDRDQMPDVVLGACEKAFS